jgi:hypothetical protein
MELSPTQLSDITELAELFYSPADIAVNIGVDEDELTTSVKSQSGEAYIAYKTGWLKGDMTLRKSIAKAAENGSNPAQQMLRDMQTKTEMTL